MSYPVYGRIEGPVVIIGFGSIGRGTLPLIERHFEYDANDIHVVEPSDAHAAFLAGKGVQFHQTALTPENYREVLDGLFKGKPQGFCVNLSVDTSSLDIMKHCRSLGALYIDTVVEPWLGFYFDEKASLAERSNYALRETVRAEKRSNPGGTTAVSCCGANPGMVSWFVKEALLNIARNGSAHVREYIFLDASFQTWADGCHAAVVESGAPAKLTLIVTEQGIADPFAGRDPWCVDMANDAALWAEKKSWCASRPDPAEAVPGSDWTCAELEERAQLWVDEEQAWCAAYSAGMVDLDRVALVGTKVFHKDQPRRFSGGLGLPADRWTATQ